MKKTNKSADSLPKKRAKASAKKDVKIIAPPIDIVQNTSPDEVVAPQTPHPISKCVNDFLTAIDDYREAVYLSFPSVGEKRIQQYRDVQNRLEGYRQNATVAGTTTYVAKSAHAATELLSALREAERLDKSKIFEALAKSFFIGLFSEFDSFMGALFTALYKAKPSLFKQIKREIALADLLEFESVDEVMNDMLEMEVDALRRKSYIEQFAELERAFGISTLRAFPEWAQFVEMSQRRNLMTHAGGSVSQQYLVVCDREGFRFDSRPALRERLTLEADYLIETMFTVSKVGFMLAHTLWRKVLPDDARKAVDALNDSIYQRLTSKKWRSAAGFGMFGLQDVMIKDATDMSRRIRIINTAIALTHLEKSSSAIELLDKEDWSASIREFRLAVAVLKAKFDEAASLMREIGRSGELVNQLNYHQWPLFADFRDTKDFQDAYEQIYGVPFLQKVSEEAKEMADQLNKSVGPSEAVLRKGRVQIGKSTRSMKSSNLSGV